MPLGYSLEKCKKFALGRMNFYLRQAERFKQLKEDGLPYDPALAVKQAEIYACIHAYLEFGPHGRPWNHSDCEEDNASD